VRVLLDENLPHDLVQELSGHEVFTVQGLGWSGVTNGELLRRAGSRVDAFVTMDRNLEHQQKLSALSFGTVVVQSRSNRMVHLRPLITELLNALRDLQAGMVRHVSPKPF
jgi:hypothetical protein